MMPVHDSVFDEIYTMEINIRKISVADVEQLSALARQTFYDTFKDTCTAEDMEMFLQQYYNTGQLSAELNNPLTYCFFVEVDDKPVAYLHFMEDYNSLPLMKKWKALELKRIYVLKEFHGKSIGQVLYEKAISIALQKNAEYIWLGVWEENPRAIRFYEKNGFLEFDKHIFKLGDDEQTDIMMKLELMK